LRAIGVRIPWARRGGVEDVEADSPPRAALKDAVSLFGAVDGEGESGMEFACDIGPRR
jgi:hypothetical protein